MSLWTDPEFQRSALGTRLSDRTLAACRAVLVDGLSGVEAAAAHKMFPAQISRALGVLRDKQAEMINSAKTRKDDGALLKFTAEQIAKGMVGDGLEIVDAKPGKTYEGPVIVNTHGFLVQKVGRRGVIHDLGEFDKMPPANVPLSITYPAGKGKAHVNEMSTAPERGKDVER